MNPVRGRGHGEYMLENITGSRAIIEINFAEMRVTTATCL